MVGQGSQHAFACPDASGEPLHAERAAYSDDHRVVIFAEDELPLDHFAVYQVPIAELFQNRGRHTGVSDKHAFH